MGIKFKLRFKKLILFISCIMLLIQPVTILASQDGSGGGPGPSMPLELTSSTPADGSSDVATDVTVTLQYSHNVADVAIRENNTAAISVATVEGSPVQAVISFSDTFALPYRQQVYVTLAGLQPYTTYIITVGPTFMSRNGYRLGTTDSGAVSGTYSDKITFTTGAGAMVQQENSEPVNTNQISDSSNNVSVNSDQSSNISGNAETNTAIGETTQVTSETLQNTNTEETSSELQETNKSSTVSNLKPGKVYEDHTSFKIVIVVIFIAAILIAGGVYIYFRKKKNGKI